MLNKGRRAWLGIGAIVVVAMIAAVALGVALRSEQTEAKAGAIPTSVVYTATNLLDLARMGTWSTAGKAVPPIYSQGYKTSNPKEVGGYQEVDVVYANGKYYLFSTGSQEPAWTDVYVGNSPEELMKSPPAFTHVAPVRYPTVVKDGDVWHIWGVNPTNTKTQKWTEHWISTNAEPTDFRYADTPYAEGKTPVLVDLAVRKNAADGKWYSVGFETWANSPLLLAVAPSASGPWTKLNYVASRKDAGVFGDTGAPPWAAGSRPDPNLAFTDDGRAWVFFTGKPLTSSAAEAVWRGGVVELDIETGKAIGNAVILYDPEANEDLPFKGASDLILVQVEGENDRIFAYSSSAHYPLAIMEVPESAVLPAELTASDLVRLDMETGFDRATGMSADIVRPPYEWGADGLAVMGDGGGATGYLAAAQLTDFSMRVEFTPQLINNGDLNMVAHVGGPISNTVAGLAVMIDARDESDYITAVITGTNKTVVKLSSSVSAVEGMRYDVELQRSGASIILLVNGEVAANGTGDAVVSGLESWSLAAQQAIGGAPKYPFQGVIHGFSVTGGGEEDQ